MPGVRGVASRAPRCGDVELNHASPPADWDRCAAVDTPKNSPRDAGASGPRQALYHRLSAGHQAAQRRGVWKPGLPGIEPEQPDSSTRTSCSETYGRQWCAYCGARVHPNLTYRGAGCISSRLPSPAVAEGHVPAPSHGLHNGTTQPARVRGGSTGLKVEDNSQVCAN